MEEKLLQKENEFMDLKKNMKLKVRDINLRECIVESSGNVKDHTKNHQQVIFVYRVHSERLYIVYICIGH